MSLVGGEEDDARKRARQAALLLSLEDIRLGLVQPIGVGQRPKHVTVDMITGM